MQTRSIHSPDAAARRRRAEERLRERHREVVDQARPEVDAQRLVHELQVHQIELEMQNEELQDARNEMEAGLEKYSDLYDFAPVAYVTLDREGTIQEANLTAASLLGIERSSLVKRRFGVSVSAVDSTVFTAFLTKVFESRARQCCEVTLRKEGKSPVEVRIEAAAAASGRECRAAVMDITERKRAERERLILSKLESTGIQAGGFAHDINSLLMVILLDLELAQELTPSGEKLTRHLEEAKNSALTARRLVQRLITFAEGGAPVRKPTYLSGSISPLAERCLEDRQYR